MRKPIIIGNHSFKTKKEALLFFREILNKYSFGAILNEVDKNAILDLIVYDESFEKETDIIYGKNQVFFISEIKIGKAQYNTKCFEIVWNDGLKEFISYTQIINRHQNSDKFYFVKSCRNIIQDDLRNVKQKYFDKFSVKGMVKCQESEEILKWEDLVVDHRQPNTFSVIVDRFIEVNNIIIENIQYEEVDNVLFFKDDKMNLDFREYHKNRAILRIVKKELNSSRSQYAKLKIFKNDLKIE